VNVDTRDLMSAGAVKPDGVTRYVVAFCHSHRTLSVGDVVLMTETPTLENVFVRVRDHSVHSLRYEGGYVLVVSDASIPKAAPTQDPKQDTDMVNKVIRRMLGD
jgi:hypothetical protein